MRFSTKQSLMKTHELFVQQLGWFAHIVVAILDMDYEKIDRQDKRLLVEGMALHLIAFWEALVESDMIALFSEDTIQFCERFGYNMPQTIEQGNAQVILLGRQGYMDFKNLQHILGIATQYLTPALNLFKLIPPEARELIDHLYIVRNHIAHLSLRSEMSYRQMLEIDYGFKRYRTPGQFLMATPRESKQIRLGEYVDALYDASQNMFKNAP